MAGDWLKMEANTPEKAEVLAITALMGWDDCDLTVGKLFRLWRWFDQHTVNGNASRVTPELLDRIVGAAGFCAAVSEAGWLVLDDHGVTLPRFDRHNGNTAKSRALTAKRVAKHKASGNEEGNAAHVSEPLPREEKNEKKNPPTPQGGEAGADTKPARERKVNFARWIEEITAAGDKAIRAGDPVYEIARNAGLPEEYLRIAWSAFRGYHMNRPEKKQLDWRSVFRNYVRENYQKLWRPLPEGGYTLTDKGVQAERLMKGATNGQA